MKTKKIAILYAILAASLYAINVPLSKVLLEYMPPTMMASFLYLGAGFGLLFYSFFEKAIGKDVKREPLTKKEFPYTLAMVLLDIAAPIFLMFGISSSASANVSLLNNFEIVATSLIAFIVFKEHISKKLMFAILLVTLASVLLSFEGSDAFSFSIGSLFVLAACFCWGFENNCTKMISNKSSVEIVVIKGVFSGFGSLLVAFFLGESFPEIRWILCVLLLGFVAYGLSINFYISAQKHLGAAKTSAYYSIAPFLGVVFSFILLGERPKTQFYAALAIMVVSTYLMVRDSIELQHIHEHMHIHSHKHSHGKMIHTHAHKHIHSHLHTHGSNIDDHSHKHPHSDHHHTHTALHQE